MDFMFTFIRFLTVPALLLLWFLVVPKCNVTIIWSERDNLRAHYNSQCRQCQIVWSSIESETMSLSATRRLWCILTLVYYCDWLGISVILGTCGRWPVMRILWIRSISGVAGHWWSLAHSLSRMWHWWHHTLTTSGAWWQWASWPSAQNLRYPEFINPCKWQPYNR